MNTTYFSLGSKSTFNKALRHFFKVNDIVSEVESNVNIADVINDELDSKEMIMDQVLPVIGAVLKDKYKYSFDSFNVPMNVSDFKKIMNESAKWTALDIVIVYFNPNGQIFVINPKNEDHWDKVRELITDHLMIVYAKYKKNEEGDQKIELEAITAIEEMISGKDVYINKDFVDSSARQPAAPAPKKTETPAVAAGKRKSTPKYSVTVTNELFHNGNVEAWKKIIKSYNAKYPDCDVVVFYEGELINDLNSLFKWGKVKHHGLIMFQVVGENIKDVSKLQKYLFEGASQRFEQFLHGPVGSVLNLF